MANTYSQIYIQIVFAVQGKFNLITPLIKEDIQKYIAGIVANRGQKLYAISCMPDHSHVFVSIKPNITISDLVRDIKAGSCKFINEKRLIKGKFAWQEGFGAFSYSRSHKDIVVKYILNQEKHHKRKTFKEEYVTFLEKFNIDFNEKYLFEWIQ
jgi:REP element-mobilizing transposase RayT